MSEKAKLKRCENDLYIAGLGVIIFCAWDVAKLLLYALFGNYSIPAMTTQGEQSGQIVGWIIIFGRFGRGVDIVGNLRGRKKNFLD